MSNRAADIDPPMDAVVTELNGLTLRMDEAFRELERHLEQFHVHAFCNDAGAVSASLGTCQRGMQEIRNEVGATLARLSRMQAGQAEALSSKHSGPEEA